MDKPPQPLSFRWPKEFIAQIDAARGDVSRSLWVRRAVERALDDAGLAVRGASSDAPGVQSPAPAEQPKSQYVGRLYVSKPLDDDSPDEDEPEPPIPKRAQPLRQTIHRSSLQARGGVKPIPKGGK